jgi:hypothetical protein
MHTHKLITNLQLTNLFVSRAPNIILHEGYQFPLKYQVTHRCTHLERNKNNVQRLGNINHRYLKPENKIT